MVQSKEQNVVRPWPRSAARNSKNSTSTLSSRVSSNSSRNTTSSCTCSATSCNTTSSRSTNASSTSTSRTSGSSSSSTSSTSSSTSTCSSSSSSSTSSTSSSSSTSSHEPAAPTPAVPPALAAPVPPVRAPLGPEAPATPVPVAPPRAPALALPPAAPALAAPPAALAPAAPPATPAPVAPPAAPAPAAPPAAPAPAAPPAAPAPAAPPAAPALAALVAQRQRRATSHCSLLYYAPVPSSSLGFPDALPRPLVLQEIGGCERDTYASLATFTAELGSGLYTPHNGPRGQQQPQPQPQQQQHLLASTTDTAPRHVPPSHQVAMSHQVAVSGLVPVSGPVAASCSCRSLAHPIVLWHHRLGHPSIPRLRAVSSHRLVLGILRVLPLLPPSLAPPCGPCVDGRLRTTPHSSSLRPATEPFETLHLDVWGTTACPSLKKEIFFLLVVDDYSRYTTMFPLAKKSKVNSTLNRWLLTTADTRDHRANFLHSDREGEFCSGVLAGIRREQGICQS
ncbi:unnamed protein product [Closterium sp. NIES-53]